MIFIWLLKRPIDNVLNFMRARNIHVKKSAIVIFALTGVITLGGAAIYLRRKRGKNQPDKPKLPECKDEDFSGARHIYQRGSDSSRRRCISTSSTTFNSSISGSTKLRLSRSAIKSPGVEKAHMLYAEGVEQFQGALSKLEQATILMEDSNSMLSESGDFASSATLIRQNSQDTITCFDQTDTTYQAISSPQSSQVDSVKDYGDFLNVHDSADFPALLGHLSVSNHERVSLDKLEEQLQSIVCRVHNLPELPLDASISDCDDDTLLTDDEGNERRRVSECSNASDTESTTSWFSARDSWEIRSTDFALDKAPNVRLELYEEGLKAEDRNDVAYRTLRTERVECHSDKEYIAKLHCLRIGLAELTRDDTVKRWMEESGRLMIESILCAAGRNCDGFKESYEKLVTFCRNDENWSTMEEELKSRKVVEVTFFDVVIDFVLMDAFEHLEDPPSKVTAITDNRWLGDSLKESAITTAVWSILKIKRRSLLRPNGFIAHLYDVCAHITPDLAWGFLGPDTPLKNSCYRFKEEVVELLASMFNLRRVRYTTKEQMAEDLIKVMRERFKSFMGYMHERVLKNQLQVATPS